MLECGHPCRSLCYEQCGPCKVWVEPLVLPCGHTASGGICGDPPPPCTHLVSAGQSSLCPHEARVLCGASSSVESPPCTQPCGARLSCSHLCTGTCSDCSRHGLHQSCQADCARILVCGHPCPAVCGALCPPCTRRCPLGCSHGQCRAKCGEECSNCKEKCSWRCQHKKCSKKCSADCRRTRCEEKCDKKAPCGHPCAAPCGELCFCLQCEAPSQYNSPADLIKLPCHCVVNIQQLVQENNKVEMLKCPDCKRTVSFSPPLKQVIQSRALRVQMLSELFFAQTLKISDRKKSLFTQCQNENSNIFSSLLKTLKESKIPISNTDLFMLETKYELYKILENLDCDQLRNKIILNKYISFDSIQEIVKLDFITEDVRNQIENVKIYSYEEGLWFWCSNCCDVIQGQCNKC